jgi:hypothetical protein
MQSLAGLVMRGWCVDLPEEGAPEACGLRSAREIWRSLATGDLDQAQERAGLVR